MEVFHNWKVGEEGNERSGRHGDVANYIVTRKNSFYETNPGECRLCLDWLIAPFSQSTGYSGTYWSFFFTYQRLYIDKIPSVREQDSFFYQASHKSKEKEPSEGLSMSKR